MTEIIPAIMPKSLEDLKEKVSLVEGLVSCVQIDVMDGGFVESSNWPCDDGIDDFDRMKKGEVRLTEGVDVNYEIDLMVDNPENHITPWVESGAKRLIFHIESIENPSLFLDNLSDKIVKNDVEVGLALNIDTPNTKIYPLIPRVSLIQFMGIARIGFQGEKFDERVLDKIKDLRERYPDVIISVDGGVSLETAPRLIEAGANRVVSGSAIFRSGDIPRVIEDFKNL